MVLACGPFSAVPAPSFESRESFRRCGPLRREPVASQVQGVACPDGVDLSRKGSCLEPQPGGTLGCIQTHALNMPAIRFSRSGNLLFVVVVVVVVSRSGNKDFVEIKIEQYHEKRY